MKKSLFCLIFFYLSFLPSLSFGGKTSDSKGIDQQLNDYWDLYDQFSSDNLDSAIYFLDQLRELAESNNKADWVAASSGAIADVQYKQGYLGEAVYNYLKAAKIFQQLGDLKSFAIVSNSIGDIYVLTKDFKKANSYFLQAKDVFAYVGTKSNMIMVYRNMAVCYREMGMYDQAKELLDKGMKVATEVEDDVSVRSFQNMLGALAFKKGEYVVARRHYLLAGQCDDDSSSCLEMKAITFNNIGETYLYESSNDEAEKWLLKALEIKRKVANPSFAQSTINLLATLYIEQEKYDKAIILLEGGLQQMDLSIVDDEVNKGLSLIVEALVKASSSAGPAKHAYLNQKFATYSQKLIAYNNQLASVREELETIGKQQVVRLAVEKHSMNTKLGAAEEKNEKFKYAIIIPVFLLICAAISVYLSLRRNARYRKLYAGIEEVLGSRGLRKPKNK